MVDVIIYAVIPVSILSILLNVSIKSKKFNDLAERIF